MRGDTHCLRARITPNLNNSDTQRIHQVHYFPSIEEPPTDQFSDRLL
jgi:hypothetical protein